MEVFKRLLHRFTIWGPPAAGTAYGIILGIAATAAPVNADAKAFLDGQIARIGAMTSAPSFPVWLIVLVLIWLTAFLWSMEREAQPFRLSKKVAEMPSSGSGYDLSDASLGGLERVAAGIGSKGHGRRSKWRSVWDVMRGRAEPNSPSFLDRLVEGDFNPPSSPILFAGLVKAKDVPQQGFTAVRVVVRNQSDQNLAGLVARLIQSEPPLDGMEGATHLPLTLATKTRLDKLRANGEALPPLPFNLNARTDKQIEVAWFATGSVLEGTVTHEAGEATFLFVERHELYVEISGAGRPIVAGVRIDEIDSETGAWDVTLICEAAGEAHGSFE